MPLIDVEKAWKTAQRIYSDPVLLHAIKNVLDSTETIEAAPVIHAAWKWGLNRYKQHGAWCTNCGCGWEYKPGDFDRVQGLVNAHKYCPNCGARMDGA